MGRRFTTIHSEAMEQEALFRWAAYSIHRFPELRLMFHVPNGGSRNALEAKHLRLQGVKAGVPDIVLPVPRGKYGALFIEMKREKGGKLSEHQRRWIDALNEAGNLAVRCDGYEVARTMILGYLGYINAEDARPGDILLPDDGKPGKETDEDWSWADEEEDE